MYDSGEGVLEDDMEAARWYRKAAEEGHREAMCNLGIMYVRGEVLPKDASKAAMWFRRAAELGNKEAMCNLAIMYINGEGVPQDTTEGYVWLSLAIAFGNQKAQGPMETISGTLTAKARQEAAWQVEKMLAQIRTNLRRSPVLNGAEVVREGLGRIRVGN
jgi:hypothetical protein